MKRYIYRFMYCILPNQLYTETPETKTATQFSVILDRRILSGSFFFTEIAYNFEMWCDNEINFNWISWKFNVVNYSIGLTNSERIEIGLFCNSCANLQQCM